MYKIRKSKQITKNIFDFKGTAVNSNTCVNVFGTGSITILNELKYSETRISVSHRID